MFVCPSSTHWPSLALSGRTVIVSVWTELWQMVKGPGAHFTSLAPNRSKSTGESTWPFDKEHYVTKPATTYHTPCHYIFAFDFSEMSSHKMAAEVSHGKSVINPFKLISKSPPCFPCLRVNNFRLKNDWKVITLPPCSKRSASYWIYF